MKNLGKNKVVRICGLSQAEEFNGKLAKITESREMKNGVARWPTRLIDPLSGKFFDTKTLCIKAENLNAQCSVHELRLGDIDTSMKYIVRQKQPEPEGNKQQKEM